jgi:hypothetical protein
MTTQETFQQWIEARETVETLEYGIRSIKVSRSAYGASPTHCRQIINACQAATRVTGKITTTGPLTLSILKDAKKIAQAELKTANAERIAVGNARQFRLALAA